MTDDSNPSFFRRLALAFGVFFRVIANAAFAGGVQRLTSGEAELVEPKPEGVPVEPVPVTPPAPKLREAPTDSALQLLGLLQREGRFIDFIQEDVSGYSDADIGAAARVVHGAVRKALESHLVLERIRTEVEGSRITVGPGFSPSELRLVGNVVGEPPFTGSLTHAGWRAKQLELPKLADGHDVHVLAQAEIEL